MGGISARLTQEYGKSFSRRNVFYMRSVYLAFQKVQALPAQLSWTHYCTLIKVKGEVAREFEH